MSTERQLRYFEAFAGIRGFGLAIKNIYPDAECVGFSEIDKHAIAISDYHYPEHKNYGDATRIIPELLPGFDLFVGGFPCQAFSVAGKRRGFEDTRGTLFFEIARICAVKRPKYILLENVKGFVSHDSYRTIATVYRVLADIGYEVQHVVLNSRWFGVPQNRERVFFICNLRGEPRPEILSVGDCLQGDSEQVQFQGEDTADAATGGAPVCYSLDSLSSNSMKSKNPYSGSNEIEVANALLTTPNPTKNQGGNVILQPSKLVLNDKGTLRETDVVSCLDANYHKGMDNHAARTMVATEATTLHGSKVTNTVRSGGRGSLTEKHSWDIVNQSGTIRRLTPIECERLQGFPDNWTAKGRYGDTVKEVSDTQRYKCCGNAVTVNVIEDLVKILSL